MRRLPENTNCAKCGKKLNFWNIGYDSGYSYIIDDTYNITLDRRFPEHPYKGKKLCRSCYKEVWEQAPPLPQQTKTEVKPTPKFTISILMPIILIILTIYQLFIGVQALRIILTSPILSQEVLVSEIMTFVYSVLFIVFLWGVLYYLEKASYSKQEKES